MYWITLIDTGQFFVPKLSQDINLRMAMAYFDPHKVSHGLEQLSIQPEASRTVIVIR